MDQNVENKIVEAACDIFYSKGYNGASMRDIARKADVNYALLHYYFKTKDRLFEIVFKEAFMLLFQRLSQALSAEVNVFEKIRLMVEGYVQMARKYPQLPGFVMNELAVNSQLMMPILKKYKEQGKIVVLFENFYVEIEQAYEDGLIRKINPADLCADILSMSLFPFIAKSCLEKLVYEDESAFARMIEQRIDHVSNILINSISI